MVRSLLHSRLRWAMPDHWPSLCTVQSVVTTLSASNQPVIIGATDVSGMVNLECRLAPVVNVDPRYAEVRADDSITEFEQGHLLINANLPTLAVRTHQVVVDGVVWQIRSVEFDSQGFSTRCKVERVNL